MKISLVDAAYEYLKSVNACIAFNELYSKAAEKAEIPAEQLKRKKSSFYSHLSLDSRFTQRENNTWDLTENHSYDETHIIVDQMDGDDEDETDETVISDDDEDEDADDVSVNLENSSGSEEY